MHKIAGIQNIVEHIVSYRLRQ